MQDTPPSTTRYEYRLDDELMTAVRRRIALQNLPFASANLVLYAMITGFLLFVTLKEWAVATANLNDDFLPAGGLLLVAFLGYFLWQAGIGLGACVAEIRRSGSTIWKGAVDGVSFGQCAVDLTDDAIHWSLRDYSYAMHLSRFFNAKSFGNLLLTRDNLAEIRFASGSRISDWAKAIRERRKTVSAEGWEIPDSDGWNRYTLPRTDYTASLSDGERTATPEGSLILLLFSTCMIGFVFWIGLRGFQQDLTDWRNLAAAVMSIASGYMLIELLRALARAITRRKHGMSAVGRDLVGVTHGASAFRITPEGIEVRRGYLAKWINWAAIRYVDPRDGWLSLRTADTTLDILPSSSEVITALDEAGFDVPQGPWATAKKDQVWKRAA